MFLLRLSDAIGAEGSSRFRYFVLTEVTDEAVFFSPRTVGDTVRRVADRGEYVRLRVSGTQLTSEDDETAVLTLELAA